MHVLDFFFFFHDSFLRCLLLTKTKDEGPLFATNFAIPPPGLPILLVPIIGIYFGIRSQGGAREVSTHPVSRPVRKLNLLRFLVPTKIDINSDVSYILWQRPNILLACHQPFPIAVSQYKGPTTRPPIDRMYPEAKDNTPNIFCSLYHDVVVAEKATYLRSKR